MKNYFTYYCFVIVIALFFASCISEELCNSSLYDTDCIENGYWQYDSNLGYCTCQCNDNFYGDDCNVFSPVNRGNYVSIDSCCSNGFGGFDTEEYRRQVEIDFDLTSVPGIPKMIISGHTDRYGDPLAIRFEGPTIPNQIIQIKRSGSLSPETIEISGGIYSFTPTRIYIYGINQTTFEESVHYYLQE